MAFVARGTGSSTSVATGVATVATVPAGGFAVGTLVVADYAAWGWNGSATAAITDTRGNTWTQHLLSLSSGTGLLGHWSTMVTTAMLAGDTVTVTMSGSTGGMEDFALAIDNHTGVTNVGAQIGTNATATSTTPSATLTPTKTGLVYGHCHTDTTAPTITEDADATGGDTWHSLTKITTGTASHIVQLAGAYKYTTSAVAQTYNPTLSASQFWDAYVVSYPVASTLSVPGALVTSNVTNGVTQAYTTLGVGNLLCVGMRINTATITPVSMSGGNATGWTRLQVGSAYAGMAIFAGTVTATGASTLTVTCSVAPTANAVEWGVREFASQYGANTSWVLNASNIVNNSVAAASVVYPTLAPLATPALYFGYAYISTGTPSVTTSGGTTFENTAAPNQDCYNITVAASIGPVGTCTSTTSQAAGMLWSAQSALPLPVTNINQVALNRAAAY